MGRENLFSGRWLFSVAALLFASLSYAQSKVPTDYPRFEVIDLGTFGGPNANLSASAKVISGRGTITSAADTSALTSCTSSLNFADCNALHAFYWRDGTLTDLGTLGGDDSFGFWINDRDEIAGVAENGLVDSTGHPNQHATLWSNGHTTDLGTFGGDQSFAFAINNRGQVAGAASTSVPDQFSLNFLFGGFFPTISETHAGLWQRGRKQDLGTLGDPDATASFINEAGQLAGVSFTDNQPRSTLGGVPAAHGFVCDSGRMFDVGTFGGDLSLVTGLNNKGQAVGFADLPGDTSNMRFFWNRGSLRDLGTLGGTNSSATWINDEGEVVGFAALQGDQTFHAFAWDKGTMRDLGTVDNDPCSQAFTVNARQQVVGVSADCLFTTPHGFFGQCKGPIVDIESLIVRGPEITILFPGYISERGEVASLAALSNGDLRVVLLRPTEDQVGDGQDHRSRMSASDRARAAAKVHHGNDRFPLTRQIHRPQ